MSTLIAVIISFTCGVIFGAIAVVELIRDARGDFCEKE